MPGLSEAWQRARGILGGESLRDRTLSSGAILLLGEGYSSGIRLLSNLIMTRLLYPEAFGIMLVVNLVFGALAMLSDVGIRSAIISKEGELKPRFINVAWTIMIIRGFALGMIAALLAKPIAIWYGQDELTGLIMLAALAPAIQGFTSPFPRLAERSVQLGRVTFWQALSQTLALAITLSWLAVYPTIWALAAHGVFSAMLVTATSFLLFPFGGLRIQWDNEIARELFHFGKWVLIGTALTFMGRQGDSLIVSRFLDMEVLGVFSIAISFAKLIEMFGERLSWGLLFPVYSEMKGGGQADFAKKTNKLRLAVYGLCFPAVVVLATGGQWMIELLYDPRYVEAGWMLEVMTLGMGFYVIASTVNSIPLAHGDSKRHMWLQLFRVLCVLLAMLVGGILYGQHGLIWGIAVGQVLYYPFLQAGVWKYRTGGQTIDLAFGVGSIALVVAFWTLRGWPSPSWVT